MTSKTILLVGSNLVHPPLLGIVALSRLLRSQPDLRVKRALSINALSRRRLTGIDALVLYYHKRSISSEALNAFESYVLNGGGVLAIHSASASFKQEPRYFDILGGRFIGHGPITTYRVEPLQNSQSPSAAPFTVHDELYRHQLVGEVDVLMTTTTGDGQEPITWLNGCGKGRVAYCALGHTVSAMRQPEVQALFLTLLKQVIQEEQPA